jgi:hypothetical protein
MKKHPVDDLFKNKLSTLERKPSTGAWGRIEAKSQKKGQRKTHWVWYLAAGIALAVGSGYLVWMMQATGLQPEVAGVELPADSKSNIQPEPSETSVQTEPSEPPVNLEKTKSRGSSIAKRERKPVNPVADEKAPKDITVTNPGDLAAVQSIEPDKPQVIASEQQVLPEPNMVAEAPSLPTKFVDENASRVIVVSVTSVEDTLGKPKASRFARVFKQLKNARAGERVDWDEVGFHPKNVLARVDNKFKQ